MVTILGFAMGLPTLLTQSTLQAWFSQAGVDILKIASVSFVTLPSSIKMCWAPFCDRYNLWPFRDRKGWIFYNQIGIVLTTMVITLFNPTRDYHTIFTIAFVMAFFAATQEMMMGGVCLHLFDGKKRPTAVSLMTVGSRLGFIASGGIALIVADHYGWFISYAMIGVVMLLCSINTLMMPTLSPKNPSQKIAVSKIIKSVFQQLGTKSNAMVVLFILVFIKIDDSFILSLGPTFLLRHCHLTLTELGMITKIIGLGSVLLGSLVASIMCTRKSISKTLITAGLCQCLTTLAYVGLALIDHSQKHLFLVSAVVASELFTGGMIGTTLVSYIMNLCDDQWANSHFALLSSLPHLSRVLVGPLSGLVAMHTSWAFCFFLGTLSMALVLVVIVIASRHHYLDQPGQPIVKPTITKVATN